MKVTISRWAPIISNLTQDFVVTPLITSRKKDAYMKVINAFQKNYKKIKVFPIYLKTPDSCLRHLLNPITLQSDFRSIFKVLLRSRPDAVISFYLTHSYPLIVFKRIFRFLLCGYALGDDVNTFSGIFDKIVKKLIYRECDIIFSVAFDLKKKMEKERCCNVIVIPCGVDTEIFKPLSSKAVLRKKWGISPKSIVILTVCRLDKNKGVDILIKALKILKSNIGDKHSFKLLIVGEGEERRSLEDLSLTLGVREDVKFLGFREMNELLELYNLSDLFSLGSYSEGLPKVMLEAMACRCIPVVTKVGDVEMVVSDGFNGYIVNPGDPEEFSEKIKQWMSLSKNELNLMRSRARLTITNNLDSRKQINRLADTINAFCLTRNKSGSGNNQK